MFATAWTGEALVSEVIALNKPLISLVETATLSVFVTTPAKAVGAPATIVLSIAGLAETLYDIGCAIAVIPFAAFAAAVASCALAYCLPRIFIAMCVVPAFA